MGENVHKTTRYGSSRDHIASSYVDGTDVLYVNCVYDAGAATIDNRQTRSNAAHPPQALISALSSGDY